MADIIASSSQLFNHIKGTLGRARRDHHLPPISAVGSPQPSPSGLIDLPPFQQSTSNHSQSLTATENHFDWTLPVQDLVSYQLFQR